MVDKANLEENLMKTLRELTNDEQDAIKVFAAIYTKSSRRLKSEKIDSLEKSITGQIEFYGKRKKNYSESIEQICNKYESSINKVIKQYDTWFCAILDKLQESYNNQKIAITNTKMSIDNQNELNYLAADNKVTNYEIVIQECKKQLKECKESMQNKLNDLFFCRDKCLSVGKANIFQKIINIFSGKAKVNNFVINALNVEMDELEKKVDIECEKINEEIINQVAVIEDAIIQTQEIFENIVKENVNYEQ